MSSSSLSSFDAGIVPGRSGALNGPCGLTANTRTLAAYSLTSYFRSSSARRLCRASASGGDAPAAGEQHASLPADSTGWQQLSPKTASAAGDGSIAGEQ